MKNLVFLMLFFTINVLAQKELIILDSITKRALPFAEMLIDDKGVYSDENGVFNIVKNRIQKATVYYLGYEKQLVDLTQTDTIFLKPKTIALDEIVLSSKKIEKNVAFSHVDKRYFGSSPLMHKLEIITTIIPKNKTIVGKLKTVSFKFDKIIYHKALYSNASKAFVRVNIYQNDSLQTKIYASEPYELKKIKRDLLQIDLSKDNIKLSKTGLVFGIEYIGYVDAQGKFITNNKMELRPVLTDRNNILYKQRTAVRFGITKKPFIVSMTKFMLEQVNKYSEKLIKDKENFTRNLAISFVVEK